MQQLAPRPSQEPRPIPYGLVSLWDMINYSLYAFVWALRHIRAENANALRQQPGAILSGSDLERFKGIFDHHIVPPLRALFISDGRLGDIATMSRQGTMLYDRLAHELQALDSDIYHAAETERFFHYRRDKGLLVIQWEGTWATVLNAFPSTREDVRAAVDCFAMEHGHASIYHCMMILERGLPALAKKIGATFRKERPTWKDMTDDIRRRIDARRNALASPPRGSRPLSATSAKRERNLLDAAGEAALEFKFFEHTWRNHIAHRRAAYDENDAKKVLEHVRTFMEVIATKLKLKEIV